MIVALINMTSHSTCGEMPTVIPCLCIGVFIVLLLVLSPTAMACIINCWLSYSIIPYTCALIAMCLFCTATKSKKNSKNKNSTFHVMNLETKLHNFTPII